MTPSLASILNSITGVKVLLIPTKVISEPAGDLEARVVVRSNVLFESYRLVRKIVDHLPVSELTVKVPRRIPEGETICRVEAPRGELFYFMRSNGTDKPDRIKVREALDLFASLYRDPADPAALLATLGLERLTLSPTTRLAVLVGFLGAFTTFSTFGYETLSLMREGDLARAGLNVAASTARIANIAGPPCCRLACRMSGVLTNRFGRR